MVKIERNFVTVLSIDGGGIRGIIPAVILAYLESQLQVSYLTKNHCLLNKMYAQRQIMIFKIVIVEMLSTYIIYQG